MNIAVVRIIIIITKKVSKETMKKKKIKNKIFIISLLVTVLFSTTVSALKNTTDNFKKTRNYENQFADVKNSEWYASSVSQAYEYGLVSGNSETSYNPTGNISVAETIALACRLNNIYSGNNTNFESTGLWYQPYVDYAVKNKIIDKAYTNYDAPATRREFATILSNSLPNDVFAPINNISNIPDVESNESNIYMLYNAGILTGNDKYGTFNPTSNIQRSEVAAIIVRMADKTQRKEFTLEKKPVNVESVTLDKASLSMTVGDTENLTATVLPNNATDKNIVWKSSNTSVATVDEGKVKAVGEGSTVITVTTANQKTAECKIFVEKKPMTNTTVEDVDDYTHTVKNGNPYDILADYVKENGNKTSSGSYIMVLYSSSDLTAYISVRNDDSIELLVTFYENIDDDYSIVLKENDDNFAVITIRIASGDYNLMTNFSEETGKAYVIGGNMPKQTHEYALEGLGAVLKLCDTLFKYKSVGVTLSDFGIKY